MSRNGLFVYGFVNATEDRTLDLTGVVYNGISPPVHVIVYEGVGVLVSDYPSTMKAMPTRKNLDCHNRIICTALEQGTVIPMAFGQIVRSASAIAKFLKQNYKSIREGLSRLNNKVEMTLRVRWDVENIFDYFVRQDRELAEARDRIFLQAAPPSQQEKMDLGRLFEERLQEERSKHVEQLMDRFRTSTADVKVNPPKGEKTVLDLVMLVDRTKIAQFEQQVYQVAETYPNQYTFDFNGPWAPFSFADLTLRSAA